LLYFLAGIPIELIPSTDSGNIKSVNFKRWIKLRTHLEQEEQTHMINNNKSTPASDNNVGKCDSEVVSHTLTPQSGLHNYLANTKGNIIVECPSSNDVIFRMGESMNFHLGNIHFQSLIESRIHEHSIDVNTTQLRKAEIGIEIMNEVLKPEEKNNGCGGGGGESGRFLTWDRKKKWWLVIHSEDKIRLKIYHAFLGFKKNMLKEQQQQQEVQTTTNSIFEQQQDGQKKKRYNNNNKNNSSCCSNDCGLNCGSDGNNNRCNTTMPCLLPYMMNNNGNNNINNNNDCGHFFSTDDGSYAYIDDGSHPKK
jgi:hypothetical protein